MPYITKKDADLGNNKDRCLIGGILMKKEDVLMIPFVAHESAMNRMERTNKRLWIVILIMFIGMMIYFLLPGHITCSKNGIIYDTFDCRNRQIENVWLVK